MPITVKQNKNGGYAVLRARTDETVTLANVAGPSESVGSMSISEIMWSVSGSSEPGFIDITRDSDTVLTLTGSGHHDYQAAGMRVETADQLAANVGVVFYGDGSVLVKLHKVSGE